MRRRRPTLAEVLAHPALIRPMVFGRRPDLSDILAVRIAVRPLDGDLVEMLAGDIAADEAARTWERLDLLMGEA